MQLGDDVVRISAVICTYRRPDVLPAAVESLLSQTLPLNEYEILVVDNNSRDGTAEIVKDCAQRTRQAVKYALEARQGLSYARNTAVRLASADIIAFLDDDAVADPNWLAALLEVYNGEPDAWAVGGKVLPIWDGQRPEWLEDRMLRALSIVDWGEERRPLTWPERVIGTNCSFRRCVFSELGLFTTALGRRGYLLLGNEDTEIQERIHERGKLVLYTPYAVVHHHVPEERLTKKYFYSRAYGHGRSRAILVARQQGHSALLREALRTGVGLAWRSLRYTPVAVRHASIRFHFLQAHASQFGFLYQSVGLLLRGKHRRSPERL
jgi:glycosyltransferase involved in cell wall biosynthesis